MAFQLPLFDNANLKPYFDLSIPHKGDFSEMYYFLIENVLFTTEVAKFSI